MTPGGSGDAGPAPVVAGWDGTPSGCDALALAALLARTLDAPALVVHVSVEYPLRAIQAVRDAGRDVLGQAPLALLEGIEVETRLVPAPSPAEGLHRTVEEAAARLVVVGSTRRGPAGRVVGTTASHLLHGSPCAVAVAPAGYADRAPGRLGTVAVAYDGGAQARAAADVARALAERGDRRLRAVAVAEWSHLARMGVAASYLALGIHETEREQLDAALRALAAELEPAVAVEPRLCEGDPAAEIAAACADGVDLLVMGSRGYGTVRRVLLGSVSSAVMERASCPVLVVPHRPAPPSEAGAAAG